MSGVWVPNGLKSQYRKLKTNQGINLANISILEATDTFLPILVSWPICNISKNKTFLHSINVNKIVLEYTGYSIKNWENLFGWGLDFTTKNWLSPTES